MSRINTAIGMLLERNRYLRCSFPKPNIRDTDRNWPPIRLILRLWPQINWIRSGNPTDPPSEPTL